MPGRLTRSRHLGIAGARGLGMIEEQRRPLRNPDRTIMIVVLTIALLVRLPLAFYEFARHPDEIWQYLEPAYRLNYGRGIVTWEYRAGIRSWLIPMMLAAPLAFGKLLLGAGALSMVPLRLCLIVFSLGTVWAGTVLAGRISRVHAIVAGLVLAIAFEPVLMSGRALSETFGTTFLFAAAVMLIERRAPVADGRQTRWRWLGGGMLAALTVASRVQFGPAAATLVLLTCAFDGRKWGGVIAGSMLALVITGCCDVLCGGVPLRWMEENFRLNLVQNVSAQYGVEPVGWFVTSMASAWGPTAPLLLLFIVLGARREPILLVVALVNLLLHSLIPHKEFRFILPSIVLLTFVGALGSADVLGWISARGRHWRVPAAGALTMIWVAASASAAFQARRDRVFSFHSEVAMWHAIHVAPGVCGVASIDLGPLTMAQAYIDRAIPTYLFWPANDAQALFTHRRAFNMVATQQTHARELARGGYRLAGCFPSRAEQAAGPAVLHRLCLFERAGSCDPAGAGAYEENEVRHRLGI